MDMSMDKEKPMEGQVLQPTVSQTPSAPDRRRRRLSQVEPNTPPELPVNEARLVRLLNDALAPLHSRLDEIQESQIASSDEAQHFHSSFSQVSAEYKTMQIKIANLEKDNNAMKQKLVSLEAQSRRSNLRFHGLRECRGENAEELVLEFLSNHDFPHDPRAIERAHRFGPQLEGKVRPIIVKFNHFKDREIVWRTFGHGLIPPPYNTRHVREDFPSEVEKDRAKLLPIARAAQHISVPGNQPNPRVRLVVDRLFINNQRYTVNSLDSLPDNLQPSTLYTPMTSDKVAFYSSNSPLSNHYPSPFVHKGERFNCGEQFIMVEKARFCGDQVSVKAIMEENEPVKQKQIGKNIKNFDLQQWQGNAQAIIMPGLLSKFEQCKICHEMLVKTGDRNIFEANPHDSFFGVGVSVHSPAIWNTRNHKGKNIMGHMLENIRGKLNK